MNEIASWGMALLWVPCFFAGYEVMRILPSGESRLMDATGELFGGAFLGTVLYFIILSGLGSAAGLAA